MLIRLLGRGVAVGLLVVAGCEGESVGQKASAAVEKPTTPGPKQTAAMKGQIPRPQGKFGILQTLGVDPGLLRYEDVEPSIVGSQIKVLELEYQGEEVPLLTTLDPDTGKLLNVNDHHRTFIVSANLGDEIRIHVVDSSRRSRRMAVDGLFVDGEPKGTVLAEGCVLNQDCVVKLPRQRVTCESPVHRLAFHTITERMIEEEPNELEGVFIRDPLVIIVPKDDTCQASGSPSSPGSTG